MIRVDLVEISVNEVASGQDPSAAPKLWGLEPPIAPDPEQWMMVGADA
jgi:hypothetical protein